MPVCETFRECRCYDEPLTAENTIRVHAIVRGIRSMDSAFDKTEMESNVRVIHHGCFNARDFVRVADDS